ncbi:MAG: hypothetical protein DWQ47_16340 [Acidobacteria bacterium]|nr:MAG: hypothetical protein DWQ47_16340 [Acidobacteriota bacterium]
MSDRKKLFPAEPEIKMSTPCADLERDIAKLTGEKEFRIFSIFPADNPRIAILIRDDFVLRLEQADSEPESKVFFAGQTTELGTRLKDKAEDHKPIGERFEVIGLEESGWQKGRAGMLYRDLVQDRAGGRLIASHVKVSEAGETPDYVHFHDIDFQIIYCIAGTCRLVYEDQGDVLEFRAGDCVLQPPGIRHRVLDCSEGFEVLELTSPAEHITYADHELQLPNSHIDVERKYRDQKFHFHRARASESESPAEIQISDLGFATPSAERVSAERFTLPATPESTIRRLPDPAIFVYLTDGEVDAAYGDNSAARIKTGSALFCSGEQELTLQATEDPASGILFQLAL